MVHLTNNAEGRLGESDPPLTPPRRGVWGVWGVWGEVYSRNARKIEWRTHSLFTFSHLCDYLGLAD
ncbi:hypothetical protein [Okeania sp. SIO2C2]|uniref:hypothetical protein n=1 Tax=Okeania sp. SIO2C2 TaxID=2607787 RepID=UPI00257BBBCD|nr:hypothetical protein [Okeania sp. SIO2C2]